MESIGKQVTLPMGTAMQIAMQGIKIRLGRALVTISGVVLGVAFLMSILCGNLVNSQIANERDVQQKVKVMMDGATQNLGIIKGSHVAIAVFGKLDKREDGRSIEREFVQRLLREKPAEVRAYGFAGTGLPTAAPVKSVSDLAGIAEGASLLILLGDGKSPVDYEQLTTGMAQTVTLDSYEGRFGDPVKVKNDKRYATRALFFGEEAAQAEATAKEKAKAEAARVQWIMVIALLVTVFGIANSLLMSVTERFKEIGTMKCLGALSSFIRQLFLIESAVIGFVGSFVGIIVGILFPMLAYSFAYGFGPVFSSMNYPVLLLSGFACLVSGCALSMIAAIYPANIAARMIPAMALRTNV